MLTLRFKKNAILLNLPSVIWNLIFHFLDFFDILNLLYSQNLVMLLMKQLLSFILIIWITFVQRKYEECF